MHQCITAVLLLLGYAAMLICLLPERVLQLPMLRQRWLIIVFGIVMQYVHGIFTQLAHRMHQPQEQPLHDMGFELTPVGHLLHCTCVYSCAYTFTCRARRVWGHKTYITCPVHCYCKFCDWCCTQELGPEKHWVSEAIFGTLFASFAVWSLTPFVLQHKRFYTVVMWSRLLMVLVGAHGSHALHACFGLLPCLMHG